MKKVIPSSSVLIPDNAQKVFEGQIFDVYQWPQKLFDGSDAVFEMLKRPDTVVTICIVDDKVIVLDDEQPNRGSRKTFPGGRVDETDPSIEAAAQREVHEETGFTFKNWRLVKVVQPHNKLEWFVHVLLAWEPMDQDEPHVDPGEKITLHKLSLDELKALIANKSVYMPDSQEFFKNITNVQDLLQLPEFSGQTVVR